MVPDRIIAVRTAKTVYRDGDTCVKVFDATYSKADILNEAQLQARAEETGLPVPAVLEVMPIDGKWAIRSTFIPGKTLERLMKESPEKADAYLDLFVDIQLAVQATACARLPDLRDKMDRKIERADLDTALQRDLQDRLMRMPRHQNLCHGNFEPSNIIISGDGTPYILDWPHATCGNAFADAAETYRLWMVSSDREGAERYLERFCRKSGADTRSIREWMPFVAAARFGQANEKERQRLLSWMGDCAVDND